MKKLILIILFLLTQLRLLSQVAISYTYSETTGTYVAITGGTQLVTTTGGVTAYDTDGSSVVLAAGSQFTYNAVKITSVNMTADGALWLNPTTTTTGNGVTGPISSGAVATGVIAAMGMDLRSTSLASQVYERRWQDVGTEVVFQWQNVARYLSDATERFSFQIRINKSTGVIKIVYGNMTTIANNTTYQPMVGLRGSTNTDFNNRRLTGTVPDATPNWGAPNGTTAGTSNAHTVRFTSNGTCYPTSGLTFIWTPVPVCNTPSALTGSYTSTSVTFSWTAASPIPSGGYQWEIRTSGVAGSGAVGLVSSGTTTSTSVTYSLSPNTTYYLYVRSDCGSGSYSSWTTAVSFTTPPINNLCADTISLTVNSSTTCTTSSTGNTIGGTQSIAGCSGTADDDIWYSFTATSTSHIITVTPGTLTDAVLQIYSGTCAGLTSLSCIDNTAGSSVETVTLTGLSVGTTYLVRVYSYSSGSLYQGTFTICVTTPVVPTPPINNACSGAITITAPYTSTVINTTYATSDIPTSTTACSGTFGYNVWYTVVGNGNTFNVTTCDASTNYDTYISIYTGSCGSLNSMVQVTCNDDDATCSLSTIRSSVQWCSSPSTTYYISLSGYIGLFSNGYGNLKFALTDLGSCSVLPIELISFDGFDRGSYNLLNWVTATETNNDYYTLERSINGYDWYSITNVKGAGTVSTPSLYEYKDYDFTSNTYNYYRLKQTDFDGRYKYFNIISVDNVGKEKPKVIKITNVLGQEIPDDYVGLIIEYYSDGSTRKIYK